MADPLPSPSVDPLLEVRRHQKGARPGDAYVKIVRPYADVFERGEDGGLVATERTILQREGWHAALRRLRTILIGRPISTDREGHERLSRTKALAIFSSDNISSSAYATEEMMRILVISGIGAITLAMPLTILICAVLAIVATSYWQTIRAYPNGASSYLVTSDNLGHRAGLVAGASLLIDYTLTVAVSVSAAVAAITSVAPELFDLRVLIGVSIVLLLMVGNLRGIRESGTIFMAPTYLYIAVVLGMIGMGVARAMSGTLPEYVEPAGWRAAIPGGQALGVLLILRAFSSGAAALTGVEAISDGVPAFKPPEWRNARVTLVWAAGIFATLFLGISFLASVTGVIPDPGERQTVLSQIARLVYGDGVLFVVTQVATVLVLALAANTAFADFPRLSSFLARDSFMPRQFAFRGERLAFTTGIVALSGLAVLLLVVFSASVTALIPLYTLGVFLAFTLSQSSMVLRWWRRRETGWRRGLVINGAGALTTGVIALIVAESKFLSGAWMVIVAIPVLVAIMLAIRGHYASVDRRLASPAPQPAERRSDPIVVVPIARLNEPARQALAFAAAVSTDATAVHVTPDMAGAEAMREAWAGWSGGTRLVIIESPYRALVGPLMAYLDVLQRQDPSRPVLVVLSEFVPRHWWENLLHNQTALRLKLRLFARPNTMVTDVPYHLP
ncbi:MAG: APC family permease [Chloroflexota bacterium]